MSNNVVSSRPAGPLRVAWIGPFADSGGVPGMGRMLLAQALALGTLIDLYTGASPEQLPQSLKGFANLRVVSIPSKWSYGRWYSRKPFRAFVSSSITRTLQHRRLCRRLISEHATRQYDCIFQVSQTELFLLGKNLHLLPPIVIYPCVHAAGELRWHRLESRYARQSESTLMHYAVRLYLTYRARIQRRETHKPVKILGMSARFNELFCADNHVAPEKTAVLYHPIAAVDPAAHNPKTGKIRLLYVSRMSVRKGLEQIIELSRRLDDLADEVTIDLIGDRSQWSNYMGHLKELNPRTARYLGGRSKTQMDVEYATADALLLPSRYEPGGLVVGEALAFGLPVVVSDEVGSAEPVARTVARVFPAGYADAFEAATRRLIDELRTDRGRFAALARAEAARCFDPAMIGGQLLDHLRTAAGVARS